MEQTPNERLWRTLIETRLAFPMASFFVAPSDGS